MKNIRILIFAGAVALLASCTSHRHNTRADLQYQLRLEMLNRAIEAEIASESATRLIDEAQTWIGTPYKYGGRTKHGTDCSGFIVTVYETVLGIKLPRTANDLSQFCKEVAIADLQPGDMLFFKASDKKKGPVTHVGMYMGSGRMIHASSSRGVRIDDINTPYFLDRYAHCGRVAR